MSLALIEESAKEVRRLAIAGSPLAVGDFRLKKLIPPLEQAGAKVPVFAQVAKAIGDLVNGPEKESAPRLLNLSMLLNAILYTQGQSAAAGDAGEIETFATNCSSTRTPARLLKPLIIALTTNGAGRLETIRSATERGAFNDLRLIDPAIQGLGDTFPEIADFVAEKILPGYGAGIVPRLKSQFDLKGKKHDGRKLKVMHQLDRANTLDLCKTALDDGSAEVKAAAIECLGQHEDCLTLVLEQAGSKNKQLRIAALQALASHEREDITNMLSEMVKGKSLELLAVPMRTMRSKKVLRALLDESQRVFDLLIKNDPEQIPRFWDFLNCLEYRKDPEVETFLLGCLAQTEKLNKVKAAKNTAFSGADVSMRLANHAYRLHSPKAIGALLDKRDLLPAGAFTFVLRGALQTWTPAKVFEEFSPMLGQTKGAAKDRGLELSRTLAVACATDGRNLDLDTFDELDEDGSEAKALKKLELDPRWLDAAIKIDDVSLVCALARPGHKGVVTYLLKQLEAKKQDDPGAIIEALAQCKHPNLTDLFLQQVKRLTKKLTPYNYELYGLFRAACHLPKEDLPKLDEFAGTLDEKVVDAFLEAIGPLRTTPPTP